MRAQARFIRRWGRRIRRRAGIGRRRREYFELVPLGEFRVEIGSGDHPTPGYFHVDVFPWAPHLETVAEMWALPLPDSSAVEIRAIHSLEHVPPPKLLDTLREWRRALVPGGVVHVSVPNAPAIMGAFERASIPEKWPLMGSILGMYCNPASRDPLELSLRSDHQLIFDCDLLTWALREAGFAEIADLTNEVDDRHSLAWRAMVDRYSLVMSAVA